MPTKLFIGNLSFKLADAELNELFAGSKIPVNSVTVMRDVDTGRSRGFAFAELAPEADMDFAIKELNGKVIDGRALTVNEARPQKKREFRGRDSGRRSGERERPMRSRGPALY
jgi:RNA recognition motif-containing protein